MTEGTEVAGADEAEPALVEWLSDYVYGTIATLVAVAGLTFETHPEALTSAGIILVGAVAIWLAHALSRLVSERAWLGLELSWRDIGVQLGGSWAILVAGVPALFVFLLAGLKVWTVHAAFVLTDVIGVASLAMVGIATVGGAERPLLRRIVYVVALVAVGALIVLLESLVHFI
ncbi:MAG: hypothetical protein JO368_08675 [Acidimicrobiales bacterium]|nr:hypothetical protein [Acidimicrobiales bacterium]